MLYETYTSYSFQQQLLTFLAIVQDPRVVLVRYLSKRPVIFHFAGPPLKADLNISMFSSICFKLSAPKTRPST